MTAISDCLSDSRIKITTVTLAPGRLWCTTGTTDYSVLGGRDVLIIAPDQPLHNPKAVARRPGQLTEEDKQTLLSQGVSPEGQDDLAIVKARCEVDKRFRIVGVKSGQLSREEVMESIRHLLTTTKNDGGIYYYSGLHLEMFRRGEKSNIRHMRSAAKKLKPCLQ